MPEKVVSTSSCAHCNASFDITDVDMKFYETMEVPVPTWCPSCRLMRKMAWCNEGVLYRNRCKHCSRPVISYLPETDEREVLCLKCYYGDNFDPLAYGQSIDWDRSMFDQIHELEVRTPHLYAAIDDYSENSEYIHCAGQSKNCYLTFHADYNEDCYYGYGIKRSKDCCDNHYCHESQHCYECIDVSKCNNMFWCQDCENCGSCWFVRDCVGCHECFLCTGLRNKKYCFLNEQLTEKEYTAKIVEFDTGSNAMIEKAKMLFQKLQSQHTYKHLHNIMCENVTGNHLTRCKDVSNCFDCTEVQDSKHCFQVQFNVKNCYDLYQYGIDQSFCYETDMAGIQVNNLRFCHTTNTVASDCDYCIYTRGSKNCFGCVSLNNAKHCILNKQYSKSEFESSKTKLIQKMTSDGEWGEFFPIKYSESCYNETIAQLWFPLTKEKALEEGFRWQDDLPGTTGKETLKSLPDHIGKVDRSMVNEILACETCSKNYRIVAQELAFYLQHDLPLPRECFDCRRERRFHSRVKRDMRMGECCECSSQMETVYPESFAGRVACEECYKKRVY